MWRRWRLPIVLLVLLVACRPADRSDTNLRVEALVLDQWQLAVSSVGFVLTVAALVFGLLQYRRAEQWKRAEFLAGEMKEFFENPKVRTALTLSDWGSRQLPLMALVDSENKKVTHVTRQFQCAALLPHTLVAPSLGSDPAGPQDSSSGGVMRRYSPEQAVVRDCYDAYLDGLERFGSFLSTGLVSPEDLRPYLGYWIDDLAADTKDADDAAWALCLLTYLQFYGFTETVKLFAAFRYDIKPSGRIYLKFAAGTKDKELVKKLNEELARELEQRSKKIAEVVRHTDNSRTA